MDALPQQDMNPLRIDFQVTPLHPGAADGSAPQQAVVGSRIADISGKLMGGSVGPHLPDYAAAAGIRHLAGDRQRFGDLHHIPYLFQGRLTQSREGAAGS